MDPANTEPTEGVSRRTMLKRIGAGAAVAWTAPVLTSIATPAFAASAKCGGNESCGCVMPCESPIACHNNASCNCWVLSPDNGGGCKCLFFVTHCGQFADCPNGQSDCDRLAPGTCCVQTCCGQTCAPACGTSMKPKRRSGARTTR